jgi:hypothetical protein
MLATARLLTRSTGMVDLSARPDSPVVATPARRGTASGTATTAAVTDRARAGIADRLHRLAAVLEPRTTPERHGAATPAGR